MTTRFQVSHKGIAEILVGPEMAALSAFFAEKGKEFAIAISPRSSEDMRRDWGKAETSPRYADNFKIEGPFVKNLTSEFPTRRACVELANTSRYAEAVEQGWQEGIGRQPNATGHHVLAQTLTFVNTPYEGPL